MKAKKLTTKKDFLAVMTRLRACYARAVPEDIWIATVSRYYDGLAHYSLDVLVEATDEAWRRHTTYFPTLGQLNDIAAGVRSKQRATMERPYAPPVHDGFDEEGRKMNIARCQAIIKSITEKANLS